ncbi:hypothetical protein B0T25DRAFT_582196 [Lasiosphaeria hispida]|uniref:Uncharacterized protein n=1 Tax=Lasiosphaeria hispida TaxID=260671 RepID=A0AAJ0HEA4_9PEZI|nr:hypothetical protein B0T25DRAFT_582196 [Lasiosphaeria hispida]
MTDIEVRRQGLDSGHRSFDTYPPPPPPPKFQISLFRLLSLFCWHQKFDQSKSLFFIIKKITFRYAGHHSQHHPQRRQPHPRRHRQHPFRHYCHHPRHHYRYQHHHRHYHYHLHLPSGQVPMRMRGHPPLSLAPAQPRCFAAELPIPGAFPPPALCFARPCSVPLPSL